MATKFDINRVVLAQGAHRPGAKACLLEAVSQVAGEAWSDQPHSVSTVLAAFGRSWNDGMRSDEERDSLRQYITRLIGTAGDKAADERRAWLATDWLVRVCAPAWLRLAELDEHADKLAALQPIANAAYAVRVQGDIAAAGDAARAAAGAAAAAAAWSAAGAAAWAAAWSVAGGAAAAAAWAAPRAAAGGALEPTVLALQASGHVLFDKMILADEVPNSWSEDVHDCQLPVIEIVGVARVEVALA